MRVGKVLVNMVLFDELGGRILFNGAESIKKIVSI